MKNIKNTQKLKKVIYDKNNESGMALLISVLILVLIMGIITATTFSSSRNSVITSAQISENNAARTAALVGISAMTQYAQKIHSTPNTATVGGGGTSVAIPNGGIAVEMPVGTTASANINNENPYYQATVNAVVTANTFIPANGETPSKPGIISIISKGKSGNASATAEAVIAEVPVQTTASNATAPYAPPAPETVIKLIDMYWLN